jgi:putative transcriptional regulator
VLIVIKSNLKALLDERELSLRQVSRDIDHRLESIRQLYNDELERFPRELLNKLCNYLEVSPGDIIKHEKEPTD